jgi:hypothetical protein
LRSFHVQAEAFAANSGFTFAFLRFRAKAATSLYPRFSSLIVIEQEFSVFVIVTHTDVVISCILVDSSIDQLLLFPVTLELPSPE